VSRVARRLVAPQLLIAFGLVSTGCSSTPATPAPSAQFVEVPGIGSTRVDVPRPTSGGAECTVAIPEGETIEQRVAGLREIGLFADRQDLSDEDLSQSVEAQLDTTYGGQLPADDPLVDLIVAAADESRVWWSDLEADVDAENQVYASTLEEWAAISEGAFEPHDIEERWNSGSGPVTVTFTLDGTAVALAPEYLEDWIDPRILTPINDQIADTGRRFELFQTFDQSAFVMALTAKERAALEARGWCFQ
jgi:hypothetical protein